MGMAMAMVPVLATVERTPHTAKDTQRGHWARVREDGDSAVDA